MGVKITNLPENTDPIGDTDLLAGVISGVTKKNPWSLVKSTLKTYFDTLYGNATLGANTFTALQTITQATANAAILASTGYSLTGSDATSMIDLAGTWNTSGNPSAIKLNLTNTASGTSSKYIDVQLGGTSVFYVGNGSSSTNRKMVLVGTGASSLEIDVVGPGWGNTLSCPSGFLALASGGVTAFAVNGASARAGSTTSIGWSDGAAGTGTADAIMHRKAAATIQMGADVNGAAVPQAFTSHNGITGTNIAGANFNLAGGTSTGTGRGGDVILKTAHSGTSGTTANGYTTRQYHSAKWVNLTESTDTVVANIAVASGKYSGFKMVCTIFSSDGTDHQCLTSEIVVNSVNKAGTVTATISQADSSVAASSGTLSATYTSVVNGNSVDIKVNAISSLTETVLRAKWSIVALNTDSTDTTVRTGSVVTPA